jgi:hypothetical protein
MEDDSSDTAITRKTKAGKKGRTQRSGIKSNDMKTATDARKKET